MSLFLRMICLKKQITRTNKNFDKLNIAIREPNINYCKNCLVPITICEKEKKR